MNAQLQEWLDRLALMSAQRWLLVVIGVLAAASASAACGAADGGPNPAATVAISLVAATSCVRADTHIALVVIGGVTWQWLDATEPGSTPWAVAVAGGLFVFHAVVALLAVTPISVTVAGSIVAAWLRRGALVLAATAGTWLLVAVFTERNRPGDVAVTAFGFIIVAVLTLLARARSAPNA